MYTDDSEEEEEASQVTKTPTKQVKSGEVDFASVEAIKRAMKPDPDPVLSRQEPVQVQPAKQSSQTPKTTQKAAPAPVSDELDFSKIASQTKYLAGE